jgi:thymidylate synthase (FAD)
MAVKIIDQHGEVEFIEHWGSDERIIESARMSTGGGFKGWGCLRCTKCGAGFGDAPQYSLIENPHIGCGGNIEHIAGDEKLLAYLWNNQHTTPFEMAGATFEIEAPIFVFREWHRHRTQSYSEASARYIPLANKNYMPTLERIKSGVMLAAGNRQAQGVVKLDESWAAQWLDRLQEVYDHAQSVYELGVNSGVPKELARLCVPVARYSRMRASTDLLNWLRFLKLRCTRYAPGAQWEIRQYADAIENELCLRFPRTMRLFVDGAL